MGRNLWRSDVSLQLGWCNSEHFKGALLHEFGHILGLTDEELRPDRGQFVSIGTADSHWAADTSAYTGSASFGPANYDYDSVMHSASNPNLHTLPINGGLGVHDSRIGQRNGLSPLDIVKLRDLYGCDGTVGSTEAITTTSIAAFGDDCKAEPGPTGLCQVLQQHCTSAEDSTERAGIGAWLALRCPDTCGLLSSCSKSEYGIQVLNFTFSSADLELREPPARLQLAQGISSVLASAIGANDAQCQVYAASDCSSNGACQSGRADLSFSCGCPSPIRRPCIPCSVLKDHLSLVTPSALQRILAASGLGNVWVDQALPSLPGSQTPMDRLFDTEGLVIAVVVVGAASTAFAGAGAFWLLWWRSKSEVEIVVVGRQTLT